MLYYIGDNTIKCECDSEEFIFLDRDFNEIDGEGVFVKCVECGDLVERGDILDEEDMLYQKEIDDEDYYNFVNRHEL